MILNQPKSALIPTFRSLTLVNFQEVTHVQALQNHCMLHKSKGEPILASVSFGKVLIKLTELGFAQSHKSYAINKDHAIKYHKSSSIELSSGILVPVSRRRRKEFLTELAI